jgi:hypothetical protein
MKRALMTLALLVAGTVAASAQNPGITLGLPVAAGSGCPPGSVEATVSPDGTTVSVLFSQYIVEAGQGTGVSFARKNCSVRIPVNVPQGISISLVAVDFRGFNGLPPGARSTFAVEYFFASARGPTFTRPFTGPLFDNYVIHNELGLYSWTSQCGQSPILATNSNMSVIAAGGANGQYAMATVDSEDVGVSLIYQLSWRRC